MKKIIYFLLVLMSCFVNQLFSQQNISRGNVVDSGLPTSSPFSFQFGSGLVGGLDLGSFINQSTNFSASRWWTLGSLPTGSQTVFGLRFQLPNKALSFGYQDVSNANPRIQWISNNVGANDLEFRFANNFTSTSSTLVAKMKSNGTTVFGEDLIDFSGQSPDTSPRQGISHYNGENAIKIVGIGSGGLASTTVPSINITYQNGFENVSTDPGIVGVQINMNNAGFRKTGYVHNSTVAYENIGYRTNIGSQTTTGTTESFANTGFLCRVNNASQNRGVYSQALATNSSSVNYGIYGEANGGSTSFGIYGTSPNTNVNYYAGYFNGKIFSTGSGIFGGSDIKLKYEVKQESNILDKLKQLRAINFKFKENEYLNFPTELQHGFIAQELEKIFPELVTNVKHPIFDKAGIDNKLDDINYLNINNSKEVKFYEFKAVNYTGLISVLTSAVQELDQKYADEIQTLKKEMENLKKGLVNFKKNGVDIDFENYEMSQNMPNPFGNQSIINYSLPNGEKAASIAVFDFNGKFIKEFKLTDARGTITISSSEIGKGIFLYVLITNNEPIISKKMIIR